MGAALVKCFAGCPTERVVAALGLSMSDLFPDPAPNGKAPRQVVSTRRWSVKNEAGSVVAVHVRRDYDDGSKEYAWEDHAGRSGLGGRPVSDLPLYACEMLAVEPQKPVLLCEGEKATDAALTVASGVGVVVVGTVTGASSCPIREVLACLAGRDVYVWPDNDRAGHGHAWKVCQALRGVASSVRVVRWIEAPASGDVADFLEAGHAADDVDALLKAATPFPGFLSDPDVQPPPPGGDVPLVVPWRTVADIRRDAQAKPREWLLDRVLYFGSVALLIGGPKVAGKSTLAWGIVASARAGEDLFGRVLKSGKQAIVWLAEEADIDLATKLDAFGVPDDAPIYILSRSLVSPRPNWSDAIKWATAKCLATGARILVVDTFYRWACFAGDDASKSGEVIRALDALEDAKRAGVLCLLLHHPAKSAEAAGRTGGMAGLGSVSLAGETEVNLELRKGDKSNPNRRTLHVESRATGEFDLILALVKGDGAGKPDRYEEVGEAGEVRQQDSDGRIVGHVLAYPGQTGAEIEAGVGLAKATVQRSLPRLAGDAAKIERTGRGRGGDPFRYWPRGMSPSGSLRTPSEGEGGAVGDGVSLSPSALSLRGERGEGDPSTDHERKSKGSPSEPREGVA